MEGDGPIMGVERASGGERAGMDHQGMVQGWARYANNMRARSRVGLTHGLGIHLACSGPDGQGRNTGIQRAFNQARDGSDENYTLDADSIGIRGPVYQLRPWQSYHPHKRHCLALGRPARAWGI